MLDERYLRERGTVYLTGMQALVRLPIDQHRRDVRTGLRTGTFISGYPGSPLAGYDLALRRARGILDRHDILHVPGANEELAATAISGTQMLDRYPHSRVDGVVALWYGKGPGVDRSGDALKHGNFAGTSRHGAVVLLSGEDHEAKSSTMPYQDDYAFLSAGIPVLYPASVAEFLELGLHAIAMSRYSGCWVALKLVGALADGGATVEVDPDRPSIVVPTLTIQGRPFQKATDFTFFPGSNVETERRLFEERYRAVVAYARANGLDRTLLAHPGDRLGIVTAGKSATDVAQALTDMGLDGAALTRAGVRVLKVGLIYPVDRQALREFARGLDDVVVVEEKRGFLESQVKEALYDLDPRVRVVGKADETGAPLFPVHGGMDADAVAERLGPRLLRYAEEPGIARRLDELRATRQRAYELLPGRTANYCSGCPHNVSTRLADGQLAWGSPGCHSFASIIEQPERHIVSMTQLGGEGAPWIGLAPFTDRAHIVQNVGDGSLFHSSYLNIRFAVAAGATLTFRILYNGSVANTGARDAVGARTVPELTRLLEIEGVREIAVLTPDPQAYRGAALASNARVHAVQEQDAVQRALEQRGGVTVLIYDGLCANERRRRQKRGLAPPPQRFVVINPAVCEGCGHCGALTNCMSLHTIETEFGSKTTIHESSCNQDYSCLGGDCPSFVTVETEPGTGYAGPRTPPLESDALPEPHVRAGVDRPYRIYIPGVGGTGVITINALLCQAALIDGRRALSYDQTGAAQKWGPVVSSIVLFAGSERAAANTVGAGQADLYLACDVAAAAMPANLARCDPARTAAIINTGMLPTGEMIRGASGGAGRLDADGARASRAIARFTNPARTITLDARRAAEGLFGDHLATNVFMLGVAYQAGLLPVGARAVEQAIELNGVQVAENVQAFRYGRLAVADPERVERLARASKRPFAGGGADRPRVLARSKRAAAATLLDRCADLDEESRRLLGVRIAELVDYQGARYAEAFVDFVLRTAARERAVSVSTPAITQTAIRGLYKLMAYKDEYEVARLSLDPAFTAGLAATFARPRRVVHHFHPPLLRALGLRTKLALGPWIRPGLAGLRAMRRIRGTRWDPFGYTEVRREERALVRWYRQTLEAALERLTPETQPTVREIAALPETIRGYEAIKMESARAARAKAEELMRRLQ
ncbi:MAG: indolepyruvate ferredoxin oxidoreductase family protein [Betaproteobacteria bacterium]